MFEDQNANFKVEEDYTNENNAKVPQCIAQIKPPNPNRSDLNAAQLKAAREALLNTKFVELKFPRERKLRVDPAISNQAIGIVSFIPSEGATPDKEGCFGCVKLRGNFSDEREADEYAKFLMRKHDSFCSYDLVRVGQEFPLLENNSIYTKETREVNVKAVIDDVSLAYIKKKKQQDRKDREEVEERQRRLVSADTSEEKALAADDLEYYTTLRVKKAYCQYTIDEAKKKIAEAEEAFNKHVKEIAELDEKYPTYQKDYIAQYDKGLQAVGAKAEENPLISYMKKDANTMRQPEEESKY